MNENNIISKFKIHTKKYLQLAIHYLLILICFVALMSILLYTEDSQTKENFILKAIIFLPAILPVFYVCIQNFFYYSKAKKNLKKADCMIVEDVIEKREYFSLKADKLYFKNTGKTKVINNQLNFEEGSECYLLDITKKHFAVLLKKTENKNVEEENGNESN